MATKPAPKTTATALGGRALKLKTGFAKHCRRILELAERQAAAAETWLDLHNLLFGPGGPFVRLFPTEAERSAFFKTKEAKRIDKLLEALPGWAQDAEGALAEETLGGKGKFNLRLPKSLHEALAREAEAEGVSLNQLCLAKLALRLKARL